MGVRVCITLSTLLALWLLSRNAGPIFVFGEAGRSARDIWPGLLPLSWPDASSWLWGLAAYLIIVAADLPLSRRGIEQGELTPHYNMAQTPSERVWWVVLSVAAGITEEITWRGVQAELIAQIAGSLWPAVVLCTIGFAVGHIYRGWGWALLTGFFGLLLHALVWLTGSLYVAMAVHIAVNVTSGLDSGIFARRVGYGLARTAAPPS